MLRYIKRLEARDLTLCQSMISLGSCTMKLNAANEMFPVSWPEFSRLHPFAPEEQARGYKRLFLDLETWTAEITGFAASGSSWTWRPGLPRSRGSRPSRCSPTRAPRGNTPGCSWCARTTDRKSTRLNSSHLGISYAVFCLQK